MKLARILILMVTAIALTGSANAMITFDEFAVGTVITNQYAPQNVLFSGVSSTAPIIALADGFTVLSPVPPFNGDFRMTFINPVNWVEFDAGYWDVRYSGVINLLDPGMNVIGSFTNQMIWPEINAYEHFSFHGYGQIGGVYFSSINDPAGAVMDNLDFSAPVPEPATIALVGLGLLGLGARLRKRS